MQFGDSVLLLGLMAVFLPPLSDPHPLSGSHPVHVQAEEQTSIPPVIGGSDAATNLINLTAAPPPFQYKAPAADSMPLDRRMASSLLLNSSAFTFPTSLASAVSSVIKSGLPLLPVGVPDGESHKSRSLATIKVLKRELDSSANRAGEDDGGAGEHHQHQHLSPEPPVSTSPAPTRTAEAPLEKGEPSSLFDLEWGNKAAPEPGKKRKLILKLDKEYSPAQIADYIESTGDEMGITRAVWEMLQDGQIMESTDFVIQFLEAVQKQLLKLRRRKHHRQHQTSQISVSAAHSTN